MSDTIAIRGLEVACIIGVHEHERHQEQPLRIDVALTLSLREAGRSGRIQHTCDYARVAAELSALLRFRRYQLLEAAAEESAAMLLGLHPVVDEVSITLDKPEALTEFGTGAMVSVHRTRADYPRRHEDTAFGHVEILLETREAGLYLLHVDPAHQIPPHHHQQMEELEWVADGELWWNGERIPHDRPTSWDKGRVHGYENRSNVRATVFCCDMPPFIPNDEIEVAQ